MAQVGLDKVVAVGVGGGQGERAWVDHEVQDGGWGVGVISTKLTSN